MFYRGGLVLASLGTYMANIFQHWVLTCTDVIVLLVHDDQLVSIVVVSSRLLQTSILLSLHLFVGISRLIIFSRILVTTYSPLLKWLKIGLVVIRLTAVAELLILLLVVCVGECDPTIVFRGEIGHFWTLLLSGWIVTITGGWLLLSRCHGTTQTAVIVVGIKVNFGLLISGLLLRGLKAAWELGQGKRRETKLARWKGFCWNGI